MMPPCPARLRRAAPDDADAIGNVFLASRERAMPDLRPPYSDAEARAYLADMVVNPDCAVWVADREGEVVGFVALRGSWVDHLYVRPAWWRRGIGTRLLDHAKRAHPQGLRLFCFKCDDRAQAFYATSGLVPVRRSGDGRHGTPEPDVEFRWGAPPES